MKMTKSKLGVATLVSLGLLGGAAAAQTGSDTRTDDQMEVQALMSSQMTIADAVSAAELADVDVLVMPDGGYGAWLSDAAVPAVFDWRRGLLDRW